MRDQVSPGRSASSWQSGQCRRLQRCPWDLLHSQYQKDHADPALSIAEAQSDNCCLGVWQLSVVWGRTQPHCQHLTEHGHTRFFGSGLSQSAT